MTKELERGCNELAVNMDDSLAQRLMMFSEQLQMPLWVIIQNLLLADWARRCASFEVEGFSPPRIMPEFAREQLEDGSEQIVTGEALWNNLVNFYKKELTDQKNNQADLEKRVETLTAKYLATPEGKAEYERDVAKAKEAWEAKHKTK